MHYSVQMALTSPPIPCYVVPIDDIECICYVQPVIQIDKIINKINRILIYTHNKKCIELKHHNV